MLELIARGPLGEDQRQMLATASASSQQLLRIVDDILDYSRLEAQALELEITSFNLRDLLDGVVQLMQRAADARAWPWPCSLIRRCACRCAATRYACARS